MSLPRQLMIHRVLRRTLGGKAPDGCLWNAAGEIAGLREAGTEAPGRGSVEGRAPVQDAGGAEAGVNTKKEEEL